MRWWASPILWRNLDYSSRRTAMMPCCQGHYAEVRAVDCLWLNDIAPSAGWFYVASHAAIDYPLSTAPSHFRI